ncbi:hypothetical protein GCM10010441_72460 [Kitasatospora paracochleata]|uniref:serine/threonine-protein kinase n=1 Tax=Kitasatospora paracochleata TaxID=58354 RepID=UPI0031DFDE04
MEAQAGQVIGGRYRLIDSLGAGGFGRVWRAEDKVLRVQVAVKELRIPHQLAADERADYLVRADREARNAARLRHHRTIVTVHDIFDVDGSPWIVMQLVEGTSLAETLKARERLTPAEAEVLARGLLDGLEAAHEAGVIHRDVKPANVLLGRDGEILLADFGIAVDPRDPRLTSTGAVFGTPGYTAPERWLGAPSSAEGDLFSLGVTLYEAVEGVLPFPDTDPIASLRQAPRPPEQAGRLGSLLNALLNGDPARRPTVAEARGMLVDPDTHPRTVLDPAGPAKEEKPSDVLEFEAQWTGQEPLADYSDTVPRKGASPRALAVTAAACAGGGGLLLGVGLYYLPPPPTDSGWDAAVSVGPAALLLALVFAFFAIATARQNARTRRSLASREPWSLHVGPRAIRTVTSEGRREFRRDQIKRVTVREIEGSGPHAFTGIHVQLTEASASLADLRPAGWPYPPQNGPGRRTREYLGSSTPPPITRHYPVCILGPMTETQRAALEAALKQYSS